MKKSVICSLVLLLGISASWAGDVASFVDKGFSEDGKYYVFGQYGKTDKKYQGYAEIYQVDIAANDYVENGVFTTKPTAVTADKGGKEVFEALEAKSFYYYKNIKLEKANPDHVLYILDEPSIGLHQRDNDKLLDTLKHLRDLGNTLIVVEHDEDTMREADFIVDIGPGAGIHGGEVICAGTADDVMKCKNSITGQYLSGKKKIPIPETRRKGNGKFLEIKGAHENNLRNIDIQIPLGTFTCVTGVSGSGKSSLVDEVLYKFLANELNGAKKPLGKFADILGTENTDKVINIDQSPIGRSPRSNPATYIGVFDAIRDLYASLPESKARGYQKGRFSFNVKGGRCEACQGAGENVIEMNFLPDVYVTCEVCGGKRFNKETLEVEYKGKSINDVLNMSIDEACDFFASIPHISRKLETLKSVGLGYIELGQNALTLSGGEAQRVKLANELARVSTGKTLYIMDEPTTGLHFADVKQLMSVIQRLVDQGNSVVMIEHNLDVICQADYIIDLGPEGGFRGGNIVSQGSPEEVAQCKTSYTGQFIKEMLEKK